jgi:hypothetical protein
LFIMVFIATPYHNQSSSRGSFLPFESTSTSRPSIPKPVPVSGAALLVAQRQEIAISKAKKLQQRKIKAKLKRDRKLNKAKKLKAKKRHTSLSKTFSAPQTLGPVRSSVYDTKRSPMTKAKRTPKNHSYWNNIEHRISIPSDVILQESKREFQATTVLRQTQSQQDFMRALEALGSPSPPNSPKNASNRREAESVKKKAVTPRGMYRNKFGQYIKGSKPKLTKKIKLRRKRPISSPGSRSKVFQSPARGMALPTDGPGPGAYEAIDTMGSQSTLLRCSRPVTVSFSKTNRFDLLGSGDPNAYRGLGVPGPNHYGIPPIPRSVGRNLIKHNKFIPVLTTDRFDGTNCIRIGKSFYYCSRSDMLRTKFPGPRYIVKDDYLSTNTAATGGGRFNESKPLSFVEILMNRASKIPAPNHYQIDEADKYCRPSKDSVVPFGIKCNKSNLSKEEYQVAFHYDPYLTTPGPNHYDPKSPSAVLADHM